MRKHTQYTQIHTGSHARTHTHTHAHAHTRTHVYIHTIMHRFRQTKNPSTHLNTSSLQVYTQTHVCVSCFSHSHTETHTCTHSQTHIQIHTYTITQVHIWTHKHVHTRTGLCTRTHRNAHSSEHAESHMPIFMRRWSGMEIHNSVFALMVPEELPAGRMLNLAVWGRHTQTPPSLSTTTVFLPLLGSSIV